MEDSRGRRRAADSGGGRRWRERQRPRVRVVPCAVERSVQDQSQQKHATTCVVAGWGGKGEGRERETIAGAQF